VRADRVGILGRQRQPGVTVDQRVDLPPMPTGTMARSTVFSCRPSRSSKPSASAPTSTVTVTLSNSTGSGTAITASGRPRVDIGRRTSSDSSGPRPEKLGGGDARSSGAT
jgi:hypothetical protein